MIKKIFVLLFLTIFLFSCGKKGDPVFKDQLNSEITSTQNSTVI
tara:strand:+ start:1518 stop:1649 length:132 start_codon:yes stop_codon:yes gene_type:complete